MSCKVRCIGGIKDGELLDFPSSMYIDIPIPEAICIVDDWGAATTNIQHKIQRYRLEKIQGQNKVFNLLVCEDLSIDEALERLIYLY